MVGLYWILNLGPVLLKGATTKGLSPLSWVVADLEPTEAPCYDYLRSPL